MAFVVLVTLSNARHEVISGSWFGWVSLRCAIPGFVVRELEESSDEDVCCDGCDGFASQPGFRDGG